MNWTRSRIFLISLLALVLVGSAIVLYLAQRLSFDRYAGNPQVVGLPADYDPRAVTESYSGPHPSKTGRQPDHYPYPIPIGEIGPVVPNFIGGLDYPYACRTEDSGLGQPAVDNQEGAGTAIVALDENGEKTDQVIGYSKDCNVPTRVYYYYRSKESLEFLPWSDPQDAIAEVSINGQQVPFIVRIEMGTINRHIYVIATLKGPDDTADKPDLRFWNDKLIYQFRGGVGIGRRQGRISPDYIPSRRYEQLARGYAIAYSTANQTSNSYDIELAEDTLARVKRNFSARYGEPEYTIGLGGSGGAIQQYLIGQNRPGLLDAGIALFSFPDMITQTISVMDCELLEYYFDVVDADNEKWQTWSQRTWIEGFNAVDDMTNEFEHLRALQSLRLGKLPTWSRGQTECTRSWRNLTPQIANPQYTYFASLFSAEIQKETAWTYWDHLKRVYGTDENGQALRTYDNTGVQYGLRALTDKKITIAEFLKLNERIGGWKSSAEMTPERYWQVPGGRSSLADLSVWSHHNMTSHETGDGLAPRSVGDDTAIAAAYQSGQVFLGDLTMPIIDLRPYREPELDMHHSLESFSARLRMQRGQGHADNQLIWFSHPSSLPLRDAFDVLEQWLENMQNGSDVVAAKPEHAMDRCYDDAGALIASGDGVWNGVWNDQENGACMDAYPIYSNPRIVAGSDYSGDIFKCQLQSIEDAIVGGVYGSIDTDTHREDLQKIFPDGVCDYSLGDAGRPENL